MAGGVAYKYTCYTPLALPDKNTPEEGYSAARPLGFDQKPVGVEEKWLPLLVNSDNLGRTLKFRCRLLVGRGTKVLGT